MSLNTVAKTEMILCLVFPFCDKISLARLACTNKRISDLALDVLWHTLTSFIPLLRLLPESAVGWHKSPYGILISELKRDILPSDWERFISYSHRVRLCLQKEDVLSSDNSFFLEKLAFGLPVQTILPHLKKIQLLDPMGLSIKLQTLFLSTDLRTVELLLDSWGLSGPLQTLLGSLTSRCPQLEDLSLTVVHMSSWKYNPLTPDIANAIRLALGDVLRQLHNIKNITIRAEGIMDPRLFMALANLSKLRCLVVDISTPFTISLPLPCDSFTNIHTLSLDMGQCAEQTITIFRSFRVTELESLTVRFTSRPGEQMLAALSESVRSSCHTLRHIEFVIPIAEDHHHDLYDDDSAVIEATVADAASMQTLLLQLTEMPHLTEIIFDVEYNSLTDDTFFQLVSSLPGLKILRIPSQSSSLTFGGVVEAVKQSSCLHTLGLMIDFSGINTSSIVSMDSVCPHLQILDVGKSWMREPAVIASLLTGAFPNVHTLQWNKENTLRSKALQDNWQEAASLLPVFRATRENVMRRLKPSS